MLNHTSTKGGQKKALAKKGKVKNLKMRSDLFEFEKT